MTFVFGYNSWHYLQEVIFLGGVITYFLSLSLSLKTKYNVYSFCAKNI